MKPDLVSTITQQQARQQSQPDPYMILSVGKKTEQTSVQMRTDAPVWEQGFTFLVGNPDNDTLQLKILDQKTGTNIGHLTYILSTLMEKKNLEVVSQPFQLQKSGPETKIIMSMSLRILKRGRGSVDDAASEKGSESGIGSGESTSRTSSVKAAPTTVTDSTSSEASSSALRKQESRKSASSAIIDQMSIQEEPFVLSTLNTVMMATPPRSPNLSENGSELLRRSPSTTSSAGAAGLGRIQLTIAHSIQRQRLLVIVHKIANIPLKDPTNIPDPYVKLYLLPGRTADSKRKTNVVKDNCNPVFDATFEYIMSPAELINSELEVTVCTQKGFFGSPIIGRVMLALKNLNKNSSKSLFTFSKKLFSTIRKSPADRASAHGTTYCRN